MITRPLKAPSTSVHINPGLTNLPYPLLCTPKIDGWRCCIVNGVPLTASFKPIPNDYVRQRLTNLPPFDGELTVPGTFQDVGSSFLSHSGTPNFTFNVFDWCGSPDEPYCDRIRFLVGAETFPFIKVLYPMQVNNADQLMAYEKFCLDQGYEGVMLRAPRGLYKSGRSTLKEGLLLKLKRFCDSEAVILGVEELEHNLNEPTTSELGLQRRSSHASGQVAANTMGSLIVRDQVSGVDFKIGSGFTQEQRDFLWTHRAASVGKVVVYKYLPVGVKDKPRHPVFKGFRDAVDRTNY